MLSFNRGRACARGGTGKGKLTRRLEWELRHRDEGQQEYTQTVAKWLAKKGTKVPASMKEPDSIYPDLIPIWHAWHDLGVSRQSGMGVVGLPWQELSSYCADHGIAGALRLRWIRLLRAMDLTWLAEQGRVKRLAREERKRGSPRSRD